jgi:hypothetical protein
MLSSHDHSCEEIEFLQKKEDEHFPAAKTATSSFPLQEQLPC